MNKDCISVDDYINQFSEPIKGYLTNIRLIVKKVAPNAIESISYKMPAYKLNGKPLVYFAGYKSHIGLYATPSGHEAFKNELSGYKQGKGSVQFNVNEPIPYKLIEQIVAFRVAEFLP